MSKFTYLNFRVRTDKMFVQLREWVVNFPSDISPLFRLDLSSNQWFEENAVFPLTDENSELKVDYGNNQKTAKQEYDRTFPYPYFTILIVFETDETSIQTLRTFLNDMDKEVKFILNSFNTFEQIQIIPPFETFISDDAIESDYPNIL
jgi:hypothetical protein